MSLKSVPILAFVISIMLCGKLYAQDKEIAAATLISQQHPDSALIILRKISARAVERKDGLTEGMCMQQMGQICYNQGHYAQALEYYLHADKIFSSDNHPDLQATNLGQMGVFYYYNKQLGRSRAMYNKALAIYRRNNNLVGQAGILGTKNSTVTIARFTTRTSRLRTIPAPITKKAQPRYTKTWAVFMRIWQSTIRLTPVSINRCSCTRKRITRLPL
jgi:tetratricopeptide (TPR) repeat protein